MDKRSAIQHHAQEPADNTPRHPALILAGGNATRMGGGEKPLLPLAGQTLLARILATLTPDHPHIALSANGDPARFRLPLPPLRVLPDPIPGQGPLGGVLAGLEWAAALGADTLLTIPGDTPLIPPGLAAALAPAPGVAQTAGRRHHLVALWPTACAPACVPGSPAPPSQRTRLRRNPAHAPRPLRRRPFANVNTPADLAALETRLSQPGT